MYTNHKAHRKIYHSTLADQITNYSSFSTKTPLPVLVRTGLFGLSYNILSVNCKLPYSLTKVIPFPIFEHNIFIECVIKVAHSRESVNCNGQGTSYIRDHTPRPCQLFACQCTDHTTELADALVYLDPTTRHQTHRDN